MKIFAICLVKNEIDIIERTVLDALRWADKVIIADHQSTDGTWELIDKKIRNYPNVIVYGRINRVFNDDVRGDIYNKYEYLANIGDWWCRLDSDEFYIDNPREFLKKVGPSFNVVRCAKFQYYFTGLDVINYERCEENYENGNCVDALKYYVCNESETRFFRHLGLGWNPGNIWPNTKWPHLIYPEHIRLKHFQYRYPAQIQIRLDVRNKVRAETEVFSHEARADWKNRINNRSKIDQDNSELNLNQTWKDRVLDHKDLFFDDGINYEITTNLMTAQIRPLYLQVLRNTIFLLKGQGKNITTR